jgi:hypothetical protein
MPKRRDSSNNAEVAAKCCRADTLCLHQKENPRMQELEHRVARLESRSNWSLLVVAVLGVGVGVLLGADRSPTAKRLIGSGLTIVDQGGHPIIDLAADATGSGRIHVRNPSGTAEVVLAAGPAGGELDLFNAGGLRLAKLGPSPTGDGMVVLGDVHGSPLARVGRWEKGGAARLWTAPLSGPSTP